MDKFEEFQNTMAKSNELFTTFRQEMEKVFAYFSWSTAWRGIYRSSYVNEHDLSLDEFVLLL